MMLCRACKVIPIECVVRGYLSGSGWKDYCDTGSVCGVKLPAGLKQSARLEEPIFTPATKEDEGHDENVSFERAAEIAGVDVMNRLRDLSLEIYNFGRDYALEHGMILADTKFEFGFALDDDGNVTDELLLIDEVLTPDSSSDTGPPRTSRKAAIRTTSTSRSSETGSRPCATKAAGTRPRPDRKCPRTS